MSLYYLSGDSLGKSAKKTQKQAQKQQKKAEKKTTQQTKKAEKKTTKAAKKETKAVKKAEKKAAGGGIVKKTVAKVGVAPARAAFLTAVTLNAAKLATKLARVYNKKGGQEELRKFWTKFGGDFNKLKEAISKGSKQKLSGEQMGVAVEAVLATATPLLIVVATLIKKFGAGGDSAEASEFDSAVDAARSEMGSSDEFEKTEGAMPSNKPVGVVKRDDEDNTPTQGSAFSLLGVLFKTPILSVFSGINHPILNIISSLCMLGMLLYPFYQFNILGCKRFVAWYFDYPINFFTQIKTAWQKKHLQKKLQ